jgi:hypothetical protein
MKLFKTIDTSFEKFDDTVRRYLAKALNNLGLEYTHTQIFSIIFDGMKGIMQNIMFYIEDALTEQNIFTATRKKSIYSLAKISGYEAYYGSAASGTLLGSLQINNGMPSKSTKLYIQNKTKVINKTTGIIYSILLPTSYYAVDIAKPLVVHEFKIIQGVFNIASALAQGSDMETIHIQSVGMFDRQYVSVKVNGEIWQEVGNFYDMTEDGHEYMLQIGYDNTFDIIFGNDIYGKKLTAGDTITIEYLSHNGEMGNISLNDKYSFSFDTYGNDSLGNSVNINDYITLKMQNCISGGNESDTIDFIRNMVGTNSRSLVLASESNFDLFFKRFSFIGYTNCWGDSNTMFINVTCITNIKKSIKDIEDYYNMKISDMLLTNSQKNMIISTLDNSKKSFAGLTLRFKDPIIRQYAFICYVKVDSVYNKDTAIQGIRTTLANYFLELANNTLFIAKSELIKLIIDENECIKAVDLDIISKYGEDAYYNNHYIKYELNNLNNSYQYIETYKIYESTTYPGIDGFGNILLDSKLEIPVLKGGFRYYADKENKDKTNFIKIPDIQVYFI